MLYSGAGTGDPEDVCIPFGDIIGIVGGAIGGLYVWLQTLGEEYRASEDCDDQCADPAGHWQFTAGCLLLGVAYV